MISVALVDDHAFIRDGIRRNLDRDPQIEIVAEAASIAEAKAMIAHTQPQVVVLDIRLGDGNGLDLCRDLIDTGNPPKVVILSMYGEPGRVTASRQAGASAFVVKDAPARELLNAIRDVAAGRQRFPDLAPGGAASPPPTLTAREQEVLELLADGLGVSGISKRLFISESTTKTHVGKIYAKLGATNRAQALMTAIKEGLLSDPSTRF